MLLYLYSLVINQKLNHFDFGEFHFPCQVQLGVDTEWQEHLEGGGRGGGGHWNLLFLCETVILYYYCANLGLLLWLIIFVQCAILPILLLFSDHFCSSARQFQLWLAILSEQI